MATTVNVTRALMSPAGTTQLTARATRDDPLQLANRHIDDGRTSTQVSVRIDSMAAPPSGARTPRSRVHQMLASSPRLPAGHQQDRSPNAHGRTLCWLAPITLVRERCEQESGFLGLALPPSCSQRKVPEPACPASPGRIPGGRPQARSWLRSLAHCTNGAVVEQLQRGMVGGVPEVVQVARGHLDRTVTEPRLHGREGDASQDPLAGGSVP